MVIRNQKFIDRVRERMKVHPQTMMGALGIEITKLEPDCVEGKMPVDTRTIQPYGILHGGASVALAETLCSIGANLSVDTEVETGAGLEINANHVHSVREGWVFGQAVPLHQGRTTQIWQIEIRDENQRLICVSRCTIAIVPRKK